jgi:hypothetical protein
VVVFILLVFLFPYATTHIGMALMMEEPDPKAYGGDISSEEFQAAFTAYYGQFDLIQSIGNLASPQMATNALIQGISNAPSSGATLEDTLGEIWSSVVALILYPPSSSPSRTRGSCGWTSGDHAREGAGPSMEPRHSRCQPGPSPVPWAVQDVSSLPLSEEDSEHVERSERKGKYSNVEVAVRMPASGIRISRGATHPRFTTG